MMVSHPPPRVHAGARRYGYGSMSALLAAVRREDAGRIRRRRRDIIAALAALIGARPDDLADALRHTAGGAP